MQRIKWRTAILILALPLVLSGISPGNTREREHPARRLEAKAVTIKRAMALPLSKEAPADLPSVKVMNGTPAPAPSGEKAGDRIDGDKTLKLRYPSDPDGKRYYAACYCTLLGSMDPSVTLEEVHAVLKEDFSRFGFLQEWAEKKKGLRIRRHEYAADEDILRHLGKKTPVMVYHYDPREDQSPLMKMIAGYNSRTGEYLLTDHMSPGRYIRITKENLGKKREAALKKDNSLAPGILWTAEKGLQEKSDVILDVPYDCGKIKKSCGIYAMSMMLKYFKTGSSAEEVARVSGIPSSEFGRLDYRAVDRWARQRFKLKVLFFRESTVEDVIACIEAGYPVMAIQNYHEYWPGGHGRIVTGFNRRTGVLIINDVDEIGYRYRMPFADFEKRWAEHLRRFQRDQKQLMMIFLPVDRDSPLRDKKPIDF